MISPKLPHERRKDPRLEKNIPVKICQEDGDIVTETANISRSGTYCKISKYIKPMTKLKIHLLLPVKSKGKVATKKISCVGVVVRSDHIPGSTAYHCAIFFNDISQRDAETIADYVTSFLEQSNPS